MWTEILRGPVGRSLLDTLRWKSSPRQHSWFVASDEKLHIDMVYGSQYFTTEDEATQPGPALGQSMRSAVSSHHREDPHGGTSNILFNREWWNPAGD